MTNKIQTNIYLLKDEVRISKNGKNLVKKTDYDFLKIYLRSKAYKEQPVKENLKSNFRIKVFHKKTPTEVKWKEFIKGIVQDDSGILKENKAKIESFIILFINEKSGRIFASTGGYANAIMQEIASVDFGIQILARIVKADDKALKSTKERNLTGGIQGEVKFFRNDHNLYENDSFGKMYNELNASLTKQNLIDSFGFKRTDLQGDISSKIYDGPEMKLWAEGTENEYNNSYLQNNGCFVFDKFTPRNIEACDVLRVEDDTLYFYHVKKGFDNSMRDLCSQVMIAGKKVFEDVKSEYEYLQELYDDVKNNNGKTSYYKNAKGQFGSVSKSEFIQLLRNKKVVFVLAVLDSAKNERDLVTNLEDFESNIAKFALIELSKYMNGLGANFQILQLKKST